MDDNVSAQARTPVDTTLDELNCYPQPEVAQLACTMLLAKPQKLAMRAPASADQVQSPASPLPAVDAGDSEYDR